MSNPPILLNGTWELGPPTATFRLRPPDRKWLWHGGRDARGGHPVAICLLREPWNGYDRVRAGYRYGMEKVRTLDHPSILKILDIIDEGGLFGLVTEPLPGEDLYRLINHGAAIFTEADVVRILRELAAGVKHACDRGVIFENLKPSNVLLTSEGRVKIGALPRPPFAFASFHDAAAYLGNIAYCAPELLGCQPLTQRTAIYGLGITAYEMIVSRLPMPLTGNLDTDLEAIASRELAAPAELVEGLDPRLDRVVVRCLHKVPGRRYNSVAEVIDALPRQGRPVPLLSERRLMEIVTTAFPSPLAVLARALDPDDHILAQKDMLLCLAGGLIHYLAFLSACSLGTSLGRDFRRPALGHWVRLLRNARHTLNVGWPLCELLGLVPDIDGFLKKLDEVVHLRNEMAHQPVPEVDALLHGKVKRMSALLRDVLKSLVSLARFALVAVERLNYGQDRLFRVTVRRLEGAQGHAQGVQITRPEPCIEGEVYFAASDFSRMLPLSPWIVLQKCPHCFQRELFFYSHTIDDVVDYTSPDRGHCWSCPATPDLRNILA